MSRKPAPSRRRSKSINWPRAARSLHAVLRRRRIARVEIACEIGPEGSGILFMHATSTTGRRVSLERSARVFLHHDTPTTYCTLREALEDWLWSAIETRPALAARGSSSPIAAPSIRSSQ